MVAVYERAKADIRRIFSESGLSQYELAHIAGLTQGGLSNVLSGSPTHKDTQVGTLAMIAHAMGYEMVVSFKRRR